MSGLIHKGGNIMSTHKRFAKGTECLDDATNEERAYLIYEHGGQYAVYRAVESGEITADGWAWCIPCEDMTPYADDSCLVCSTSHLTTVQKVLV